MKIRDLIDFKGKDLIDVYRFFSFVIWFLVRNLYKVI